jgi:hypothetical protein
MTGGASEVEQELKEEEWVQAVEASFVFLRHACSCIL